ncbi:MAG: hypothetical protein KAG64_07585 [Bacteroidales bacterium]|nr:hypothetical protein [Bacteroidales bacterium]
MKKLVNINKGTLAVIITMTVIAFVGFSIAWVYYGNINSSEDPRVVEAKVLYKSYNPLIEEGKYDDALLLLDSIDVIYQSYDDYKKSYEVGVVYNNKAAIYLTMALAMHDGSDKDSIIVLAEQNVLHSIKIYENWLQEYGNMSESEIRTYTTPIYQSGDYNFDTKLLDNYINKRINDIMLAQRETPRRLSVSYTNEGIVLRSRNEIEEALNKYKKALELWDKNLTAKNNINLILGRPLEEQSTLERLFPDKK